MLEEVGTVKLIRFQIHKAGGIPKIQSGGGLRPSPLCLSVSLLADF